MTTVVWFKRDLRVADHPALARAAEGGARVLPLYVVEPDYWRLPDTSARQWYFTAECLDDLRAALGRLGAPLIVRKGDVVEVFSDLLQKHEITRLISHEETGNLWTFARDRRVAAWARENGVDWTELPQSGVVRRLANRDGWAAARDRFMAEARVPVPKAVCPVDEMPGAIPTARDLGLSPCGLLERQSGGRQAARSLLESFLTERGRTYRKDMSSPLQGAASCSRLSPHFALGTLSIREAMQAAGARQREIRGGPRDGWAGSLKSFQSRLAWRDHFMQKLEDAPDIERRCFHSAYEDLRPRDPDAGRLAAWSAGETGLPFFDACMRSLRATGWLNFRMRSMVTAVGSYHLWLDWRATGPVLARLFTDYEPGIHWSQVQMQSGTTGINTPRIYNPIKQGHDQDPTGSFTRRWVPELAEVPDIHLQEPWLWDGAASVIGRTYPEPIIDVAGAARVARERIWAVRRVAGFRSEAVEVVRRHASRKDGQGRFVDDRAPSRRPSDAQLHLDL